MPNVTAKDVQALRQATGAGMMDAKRALEQADGDFEAASQWLREHGLASAAKRQDRESSDGAVAVSAEGPVAAIVALRCETDFVAKSPEFVGTVERLAKAVASEGVGIVETSAGEVEELGSRLKERIVVGAVERIEAAPGDHLGTYVHVQNGRGVIGVAVELRGGSDELAHDLAVHAAFTRPPYLRREDVPAEEVEAERASLERLSRNEGKPEAALAKIVEGRLNGWFEERCLLEQKWVRDEKRSIQDLLGSAEVVRLALVALDG
jgi:elongation factor Ts